MAVAATTPLMVVLLQPLRFMAAQVLTPSTVLLLPAVLLAKPVMTLQPSPQSQPPVLGGGGADSVGVNAVFIDSSIVGGAGNDTFNASSSTAATFFFGFGSGVLSRLAGANLLVPTPSQAQLHFRNLRWNWFCEWFDHYLRYKKHPHP